MGLGSTAGERREEGDLVAVLDRGVPLDEFVVDGGFDDVGGEGDLAAGLDFVEELPGGRGFGFVGLGLRAAPGADEGEIADDDVLFHVNGLEI